MKRNTSIATDYFRGAVDRSVLRQNLRSDSDSTGRHALMRQSLPYGRGSDRRGAIRAETPERSF